MKNKLRGSAYLLLATAIWGSTFVAQSVGMEHVGPFTFQAVRCALGALFLLPVILIRDRGKGFLTKWADRRLWKAGLLCALPFFLAANLQQVGIVTTDAGKSAFLTALYIVLVPLLGRVMGRKLGFMAIFSVPLAVLGLYLLSWSGGRLLPGDLALIGCALMFAVQILVIDHYAPSVDPLRLNCLQSLFGAIASGAVMLLTEEPRMDAIVRCWLPLSYAGVLSMGVAYSLQILGQRLLEPTAASILMSLESVFALLSGWLILGERMSARELTGCALMLLAVVLSQMPDPLASRTRQRT